MDNQQKESKTGFAKRYFIDTLSAMAQGLFASLLIGTIMKTLGTQVGQISTDISWLHKFCEWMTFIGSKATEVAGPAMAIAIAYALQASPLVLFSAAAVGYIANLEGGAGGPFAVWIVTIVAVIAGRMVSKKTKIDILLTPFVTIISGGILAILGAPYIGKAAKWCGDLIIYATNRQPFLMGILVSVIVGILLTLPVSSAAICAGLGLVGLAGGAAVAGCSAQMIGFAVMSFRENGVGGLLSQGLGTSMLQMGNIVRKPIIWLPPIIASAITGPIATCVFKLQMNGPAVSSGMGTCGLVGQIGVVTGWGGSAGWFDWLGLILICFVLPAILCAFIGSAFRKLGWIKNGDLKLPE